MIKKVFMRNSLHSKMGRNNQNSSIDGWDVYMVPEKTFNSLNVA